MARGVAFTQIDPDFVTFKADVGLNSTHIGKAVSLTADATAGLGANGAPLLGVLYALETGYCTVHTGDYLSAPYTGTAPTLDGKVVVDGVGNVKDALVDTIVNAAKGRGQVISIDATNLRVVVRTDM